MSFYEVAHTTIGVNHVSMKATIFLLDDVVVAVAVVVVVAVVAVAVADVVVAVADVVGRARKLLYSGCVLSMQM